jgi:hypothetical protein
VTEWRIAGSYLEACNCNAICPCRRIGGQAGGRSTYGECIGALSWRIEDGRDGDLDLSDLNVVLATRYHDDEPGSPWRWLMYLDERADGEQRQALEGIFTGRKGGTALDHFPWAWKPSDLLGVRVTKVEIDHTPKRGWFRAGGEVVVRVGRAVEEETTVTCVIPGHHRDGTEIITDVFSLDTDAASCELRGRCGFETGFEYSGMRRGGA